jgi:hypothetical protein
MSLGSSLLLGWSLALVWSAFPDKLLSPELAAAQQRFKRRLGRANLAGGRAVFNTDSSERTRRVLSNCLMAIALSPTGEQTELYAHWPGCEAPSFRFFDRPLRRAVGRLTRHATMAGPDDAADPRHAASLAALSEVMCTEAGPSQAAWVALIQRIRILNKTTARQHQRDRVIHVTGCTTGLEEPTHWPELVYAEDGAVQLTWWAP